MLLHTLVGEGEQGSQWPDEDYGVGLWYQDRDDFATLKQVLPAPTSSVSIPCE